MSLFIERSQPREYDDDLPLAAMPIGDDAPPLTDETDSARLAHVTRSVGEAHIQLDEAMRLLSEGKHELYAVSMRRVADLLQEIPARARVLSRFYAARR